MTTICILCLTTLWIISIFDAVHGLSIRSKHMSAISYTVKNLMDKKHTCKYHTPSQSGLQGPVPNTSYADSQCFVIYEHNHHHGKGCVSTDAGTTVVITCPAATTVKIDQLQRSQKSCSQYSYSNRNRKKLCNDSYKCTIPTTPADKTKASIVFHCEGNTHLPNNGMSTEYHGGANKAGDDMSTEYYDGNTTPDDDMRIDDTSTEYYGGNTTPGDGMRVNGTSTEYYGDSTRQGDDTSTEYYGIPVYVFIVGGIVGVLLIMSIIVGVLLRRRNQSRNVEKSSKDNVTTSMNTTTERQPESANNPQANMMISPDAIQMSAAHAVNLAISTDESNTYSHLRSTEEDSDVMYDHTIRHNVHNNCDGDYGIAHRRITEDDYDVSGNYLQSLNKKADPVYN